MPSSHCIPDISLPGVVLCFSASVNTTRLSLSSARLHSRKGPKSQPPLLFRLFLPFRSTTLPALHHQQTPFSLSIPKPFVAVHLYFAEASFDTPSPLKHLAVDASLAAMADHFARAAGFAGDETTEASVMPGGSGRPGYNFDNTMDTDTHAFTGILQPAQQQKMAMPPPLVPASKMLDSSNNRENVAADNRSSGAKVNGFTTTNNASSVRIPASRVPLQPSSPANSRPSSSQSQQRGPSALAASAAQQLDTDEDDSEDELGARPNTTLANETTMASAADASEWERHIRESKNKAGVSIKQMQQRIDHLLQERDDLKIEVDILRRNYNPDDQAAELIRLRQENIRITNHRITLSELLTAQKKTIKDLQKQAKHMSSQPGPNDREAKRRLDELEDTVRLLDEQKEEEAQARLKAEEEIAKLRADLEASQKECNDLGVEREDMDQDFYRLEKERDAAEDKAAELAREREDWERERQEWEERLVELERGAQQRADETAADQLAMDERQEECERLERELEGRMDELHKTQMELQDVRGQLEASAAEVAVFRGEVDAQNGAHEDKYNALRDELAAKENELLQLEEEHEEMVTARKQDEEEIAELGARFDDVVRQLEEKEAEVLECNREIAQQGETIRRLEEEQEASMADANEADQIRAQTEEELEAQREHYEMKLEQFRQRLSDAAAEVEEQTSRLQHSEAEVETLHTKLTSYRERMKERTEELEAKRAHAARLDEKCQDMLADLQDEERKNDSLEAEWESKMAAAEDKLRRVIDEKEDALAAAEDDLDAARRSLRDRNSDLEALQRALKSKENETEQRGRSSATDRHSLELELDRLKRDLARCEQDLARARDDVDRKEEQAREKSAQMSQMYTENCELSAKLATETQTRLGLDERLAGLKRTLREAEAGLSEARTRNDSLERAQSEAAVSASSGGLSQQEGKSIQRQLADRNNLLMTVSNNLDKVLGVNDEGASAAAGGTPLRRGRRALDPSTDFSAFHSALIARVRKLSEITVAFEKRAHKLEANFNETGSSLRRQHDAKFKQMDRLESNLKAAADKQSAWRARMVQKQAELDSTKATVSELQSQISSLKTRTSLASPGDNARLSSLTQRCTAAEKKLATASAAASTAEDRLAEAKSKYSAAESKWIARIKELESRCKEAEERVKRERQGAKERVAEQQETRRRLEGEVEAAKRRLQKVEAYQHNLEDVD
ncbi:unnamed protein product [Jaminaea pallidilutea]